MKLFAKFISANEFTSGWAEKPPGPDWYELSQEPQLGDQLQYDAEKDQIVIVPREITVDDLAAQQKAADDAALLTADVIRSLQARITALEERLKEPTT